MRTHLAGTDVAFEAKFPDLVDPSSQTWKIYDNAWTLVDSFTDADTSNVERIDDGVWHLVYRIPDDARGVWTVEVDSTGALVAKARSRFAVCR